MKVKSYVVGLMNGIEPAIKRLDQDVAEQIGDRVIHDVKDTLYGRDVSDPPRIVRVVIYD